MALGTVLSALLVGWFWTLAAIVVYHMLTGRISLYGLLTQDGERFSPERLQLLAITFFGVAAFFMRGLSEHRIPEIPDSLLVVFAGSQAIYLTGKAARR